MASKKEKELSGNLFVSGFQYGWGTMKPQSWVVWGPPQTSQAGFPASSLSLLPPNLHTTVEIHPLYIDILLSHDIAYTQTQTTHTPPHSSE